jgi:hypothetical protein
MPLTCSVEAGVAQGSVTECLPELRLLPLNLLPWRQPKLCSEMINSKQQWEVRHIVGREDVCGVRHYRVKWRSTFEAEPAKEWWMRDRGLGLEAR